MQDIIYPPPAAGRAKKWVRCIESLQKYLPAQPGGDRERELFCRPLWGCAGRVLRGREPAELGDRRRGWKGPEGCWPGEGRPHGEVGAGAGEGITSTSFDEYKDSCSALPLVRGAQEESQERAAAGASRSILWFVAFLKTNKQTEPTKPPKLESEVVFRLH